MKKGMLPQGVRGDDAARPKILWEVGLRLYGGATTERITVTLVGPSLLLDMTIICEGFLRTRTVPRSSLGTLYLLPFRT